MGQNFAILTNQMRSELWWTNKVSKYLIRTYRIWLVEIARPWVGPFSLSLNQIYLHICQSIEFNVHVTTYIANTLKKRTYSFKIVIHNLPITPPFLYLLEPPNVNSVAKCTAKMDFIVMRCDVTLTWFRSIQKTLATEVCDIHLWCHRMFSLCWPKKVELEMSVVASVSLCTLLLEIESLAIFMCT